LDEDDDPRQLAWQVRKSCERSGDGPKNLVDPCRLVRQVKKSF